MKMSVISFVDKNEISVWLMTAMGFKAVDSCWISSTEWSDTFRRFFVYGKEQES